VKQDGEAEKGPKGPRVPTRVPKRLKQSKEPEGPVEDDDWTIIDHPKHGSYPR